MPTVTSTPGGASDNSYVTEAEVAAYFEGDLRNDEWQAFDVEERQRALIQATRDIENLGGAKPTNSTNRPRFYGAPGTSTQALFFPRSGDVDADGDAIVPEGVQEAVCEQAYWSLDRQEDPPLFDARELVQEGFATIGTSGISASFAPTGIPDGIAPKAWSKMMGFTMSAGRTVA